MNSELLQRWDANPSGACAPPPCAVDGTAFPYMYYDVSSAITSRSRPLAPLFLILQVHRTLMSNHTIRPEVHVLKPTSVRLLPLHYDRRF